MFLKVMIIIRQTSQGFSEEERGVGEQNNLVSNDNLHVDSDEHSGSWCGFALRAYHAFRVYDAAVVGVQGLGFI